MQVIRYTLNSLRTLHRGRSLMNYPENKSSSKPGAVPPHVARRIKNQGFCEATLNALAGFVCLLSESAAKRELLLLLISLSLAIYATNLATLALVSLSVMMLVVEALNTAIEGLCDCITLDYDQRIKKIKDLGASAVFILSAAYFAVLGCFVWGVVS